MKTTILASCLTLILAPLAAAQCVGDIAVDDRVDGGDLGVLLANWGPVTSTSLSRACDLDGDGIVNGADLGMLLANWGKCPVLVPSWATLIEAEPDPTVVTDSTLRAAIEATGLAWRVRDTVSQVEMVLIPPGDFQMGCSPSMQSGCQLPESPTHAVSLTAPFYLGRFELTQSQWTQVMGTNPSYFRSSPDSPHRPVETVNVPAVQQYLSATSMRLPSEAEWEYACRAGSQSAVYGFAGMPDGSNDEASIGQIAWNGANSAGQTHAVGALLPNGFGLYDMLGNVLEWTNDKFSASYYAISPVQNPPGPPAGQQQAMRGGNWLAELGNCRTSTRWADDSLTAGYQIGFRVARNP